MELRTDDTCPRKNGEVTQNKPQFVYMGNESGEVNALLVVRLSFAESLTQKGRISMKPTKDKFEGMGNTSIGKAKEAAGVIMDNKGLQAEGNAQKNMGKGQQAVGAIKEQVQKGTHALGDGVEGVGKKLQEKGYLRAGKMVEKIGDKLEHLAD